MKRTLLSILVVGILLLSACGAPTTTPQVEAPVTPPPTEQHAPSTYILSVSVSPSGAGSVSPPDGQYDEGTQVTLTATPASGYTFDHWSGDATGRSNPVTLTMDSDKSATAHFMAKYILSTSVSPKDAGTITPAGGVYDAGTKVTLTAKPASGYTFDHWSGDVSGSATPIVIIMTGNKNVIAHFKSIPSIVYETTFPSDHWATSNIGKDKGNGLNVNPSEPLKAQVMTWQTPLSSRFTNFALEVELTKVEGPDNKRYGIVFLDPMYKDGGKALEFVITGDGRYALRRLDWLSVPLQTSYHKYLVEDCVWRHGSWGTPPPHPSPVPESSADWRYVEGGYFIDRYRYQLAPESVDIVPLTLSPYINTGNTANKLKVVCETAAIKLYANDHLLVTVEGEFESSWGCGIGVIVEAPLNVIFYHMKMWSPPYD